MNIWNEIQNEVKLRIEAEPSLDPYLNQLILSQDNLINSVAAVLASKLNSDALSSDKIKEFILDVYHKCDHIEEDLINDIVFLKIMIQHVSTSQHQSCSIKAFKVLLLIELHIAYGIMIDIQWRFFFKIEHQRFLV